MIQAATTRHQADPTAEAPVYRPTFNQLIHAVHQVVASINVPIDSQSWRGRKERRKTRISNRSNRSNRSSRSNQPLASTVIVVAMEDGPHGTVSYNTVFTLELRYLVVEL